MQSLWFVPKGLSVGTEGCSLPQELEKARKVPNIHKYKYNNPHKSYFHQNKSTAYPQLGV